MMKNIIEAKIKETEQDYNLMGLYSNEEYAGRMSALKELLAMLDKEDDEAMIGIMENQKDCNISRKFQEAEIEEMFEDFQDDQY